MLQLWQQQLRLLLVQVFMTQLILPNLDLKITFYTLLVVQ